MKTILYLHGFLSSPLSVKATQTREYLANQKKQYGFVAPELSNHPTELKTQLVATLDQYPQLLAGGLKVIGSSMGGYLATWLIEQYGGRAVLINPAVRPFELLAGYLGDHINPYTQKRFTLAEQDIAYIRALYQPAPNSPSSYKVLLQTGDETLDYRQAESHYAGADILIEEGGDHSFIEYERHLPAIVRFLESEV